MDAIDLINVTAEAYALVLVVVLLMGMGRGPDLRKRRVLMYAMWLQIATLIGHLMVNIAEGGTEPSAEMAVRVGLAFSYPLGILTCILTILYIITDASSDPIVSAKFDPLTTTLWAINGLNLLLAISSPVTHAFYVVDETNHVFRGHLSNLNDTLFLAQFLLMFPAVVRLHERHGTKTTIRLVLCGLLGLAATVADKAVDGLRILDPAVSLILVLICVGVQSRLEEDLAKARANEAETRVRMLTAQIHPHFVFNSLAAIKELISEDHELAERSIQDFSDYLRSHLDVMSTSRLVPFTEEIGHVRHYVSLEQADASMPIEVIYEFDVEDFLIPPLTVQPLVENAIRHGVRTREGGGTVRVSTQNEEEAIVVRVSDNGHGISSATSRQSQRQRVGIENVRERIEMMCGGTIEVTSNSAGTVVTMTIPKERVS